MTMDSRGGHTHLWEDDFPDPTSAANLFHGLADPGRLTILLHLLNGEHNVRELTEHLGLAQSTVSAHLACLRASGLVESRPRGRSSMFSLTHPDLTVPILAAATELLEHTAPGIGPVRALPGTGRESIA